MIENHLPSGSRFFPHLLLNQCSSSPPSPVDSDPGTWTCHLTSPDISPPTYADLYSGPDCLPSPGLMFGCLPLWVRLLLFHHCLVLTFKLTCLFWVVLWVRICFSESFYFLWKWEYEEQQRLWSKYMDKIQRTLSVPYGVQPRILGCVTRRHVGPHRCNVTNWSIEAF